MIDASATSENVDVADIPFHLAVLIPVTGSWGVGSSITGAVALAVEQVNADSTLLPGCVLEYSWADSGCTQKQALAAMSKLAGRETKISAVIGPVLRCMHASMHAEMLTDAHQTKYRAVPQHAR